MASAAGQGRRFPQRSSAAADEDSNDEGEAIGHDMDEKRSGDEDEPEQPCDRAFIASDDPEDIEYDDDQGM